MISIEDALSHVLAYSASTTGRRKLPSAVHPGRAGPPEHLQWIGQWGIFDDALRVTVVVRVAGAPSWGCVLG